MAVFNVLASLRNHCIRKLHLVISNERLHSIDFLILWKCPRLPFWFQLVVPIFYHVFKSIFIDSENLQSPEIGRGVCRLRKANVKLVKINPKDKYKKEIKLLNFLIQLSPLALCSGPGPGQVWRPNTSVNF